MHRHVRPARSSRVEAAPNAAAVLSITYSAECTPISVRDRCATQRFASIRFIRPSCAAGHTGYLGLRLPLGSETSLPCKGGVARDTCG